MGNEDFQKTVLNQLNNIASRLINLEKEVKEVKEILLRTEEQTKNLTEFKQVKKDTATELIKKIS
jgi:hypothetical protein